MTRRLQDVQQLPQKQPNIVLQENYSVHLHLATRFCRHLYLGDVSSIHHPTQPPRLSRQPPPASYVITTRHHHRRWYHATGPTDRGRCNAAVAALNWCSSQEEQWCSSQEEQGVAWQRRTTALRCRAPMRACILHTLCVEKTCTHGRTAAEGCSPTLPRSNRAATSTDSRKQYSKRQLPTPRRSFGKGFAKNRAKSFPPLSPWWLPFNTAGEPI